MITKIGAHQAFSDTIAEISRADIGDVFCALHNFRAELLKNPGTFNHSIRTGDEFLSTYRFESPNATIFLQAPSSDGEPTKVEISDIHRRGRKIVSFALDNETKLNYAPNLKAIMLRTAPQKRTPDAPVTAREEIVNVFRFDVKA